MNRDAPSVLVPRPSRATPAVREAATAYLFVLPAAVLILTFGLVPVGFALVISLFDWRIKSGTFVGLGNYLELFGRPDYLFGALALGIGLGLVLWWSKRRTRGIRWTILAFTVLAGLGTGIPLLTAISGSGDADFWKSLQVTVWFSLGTVPVQLALGLLVALLLRRKFPGRQAFRVIFVLPFVVPAVASAAVFGQLFSLRPESLANQIAHWLGLGPFQWLRETSGVFAGGVASVPDPASSTSFLASWAAGPSLGLVCIMIYNWWVYIGYYALIFSNGLAAIPPQVYEAAKLDGAGPWTTFRRITLPLLSPVTYFLTLLGVIGTFKAFNSLYILRDPSSGGATDPVSVFIFFVFFHQSRFGYASALSMVLLVLVLGLTWAQRSVAERHVFYG